MIAQTIQLALGPAFLLVAMASILNVVTGRLARVVDRARALTIRHGVCTGEEQAELVRELKLLDRRMDIINWSIGLIVASGIVVCVMVAMLFVLGTRHIDLGHAISAAFILSMALLLVGLVLFLIEVRLAIKTIHVPKGLIQK